MPDTPASTSPPLPSGTASPAARPGTPPADTPALAVARAARVADTTPGPAQSAGLTTDSLMPTCMIYAMFAGLALLIGTMVCWMGSALSTALHFLH